MRPVKCAECEKTNMRYFIFEDGVVPPMVLGTPEVRMVMCSHGHLIVWKESEEST